MQTISSTQGHSNAMRMLAALMMVVLFFTMLMPSAFAASDTGTTNAKVVLRKSADKDSKALQTLPEGEEVDVLGTSGSWYKVRYGNFTGYVMKKYIKVSKNSTVAKEDEIAAIGTPPGAMRIGDDNSDVKKLQKALKILGYYDGKLDGDYGSGTTAAVKAYQEDHKLEADGVAGRSTVKSIFGSCAKTSMNAELNGSSGSKSTGSGSSSSSTSKYKTVNSIAEIGSAPEPTKEGSSGTNVVKLQQALEYLGYYDGAIDGDYGAGTVAAVKKFQNKRGLKADGIAGNGTIKVIFGTTASGSSSGSKSSKSYKTETLDWFKDDVTRVIPKNARFTIKDVATGETFEAVRWSGSNHIDAEPRTASDTKKMKAIYGGSWSWRRRAILILYNGHVYAASMNGMPHGTKTISGNNFDGHFCIHFKNSKTHETKKIDSEHQNAVDRASRATW
ncbi:MAG: peptidoglycan-binding protein [Oscillospiraceae bacterium]|nr:peptidoglycan-binding protein [Oscillospiraceae bacterium]